MELTGDAASRTMGGAEKSRSSKEEVGSGCSVRVERPVRPAMPDRPPEHAARMDSGVIVYERETMLANPKEDIRSCCSKVRDGTMDDVDRSLIMAGAEIKRVGNAATPFLKVMM